jgi:plastocyanin
VASAADAGILPPRDGATGGEPPPSGGPPATGQPGPGGPEDPEADVVIHALNIQFEERAFSAPAGASFTIGFVNLDANIPHNVEIKSPAGASILQGEIFNGVDVRVYDVPALDAGAYPFVCTVHPNMTGTATIE